MDQTSDPPTWLIQQMEASRDDALAGRIVTSDAMMARAGAAVERLQAGQSRDPLKKRTAKRA